MTRARAEALVPLSVVAGLFGLLLGLSLALGTTEVKAGFCPVEDRTFSDSPQDISDTDDGDDEDNRWDLAGGADSALMLVCDDGVLGSHTNGKQQGDSIGGGSGADWFEGGTGDDTLRGGASPPLDLYDGLFGGDGDDHFFDVESGDNDNFSGQEGHDVINTDDNDNLDNAFGGAGSDLCPVDPGDNFDSCTPS